MAVDQRKRRSPDKRPAKVSALSIERELRAMAFARAAERFGERDAGGKRFAPLAWFGRAVDACLARGHGAPWLAVGLLAGLVGYFALPYEPHLWALGLASMALAALSWKLRKGAGLYAALLALSVCAGTTLGAGKAKLMDAPQILAESVQRLEGTVVRLEQRTASRARLTLNNLVLEDQADNETPRRVRVTVIAEPGAIKPGDRVEMLAQLGTPPEPVMPGARNMRRELYFAAIGGTGFSYGRPTVIEGPPGSSLMATFQSHIENTRLALARRFSATLSGDTGVLAATLLVGRRDGLSQESYEALRQAGLAHLLAISGMHMAMMTLSSIALFHLLLALHPSASASRGAIRAAAIGGLVVASGYLLLSGAGTATQRAFIMIAIALVAMLLSRRALTIRAVAFAAILVVIIHPESLLGPSFQMSFAATLALVAFYGAFNTSRKAWKARMALQTGPARWVARPLGLLGGIALTSLVAGLATAPFAAYHFSVGAPLGLLGNVLALPLVSLIIMPAGLLALVLTPFALESLPLAAMGFGIDQVMVIARWVSGMEGSRVAIPSLTPQALLLLALGGLMIALLVGRARLLGAAVIAIIPAVGLLQPTPLVIIEREASTVAYRNAEHGEPFLDRSVQRGSRFSVEMWHQRLALENVPSDHPSAWTCDALGCVMTLADGTRIAHAQTVAALMEDCDVVDVIITPLSAPSTCAAPVVVDANLLQDHGAIAIMDDLDLWPSFARRTRPWEQISY